MTTNSTTGALPAVVTIPDLPTGTTVTGLELLEAWQTVGGVGLSVQIPVAQIITSTLGALPIGGGTGQVLNKASGANFSTQWANISSLVSASTGIAIAGSTTLQVSLATIAGLSVLGVAGTATLAPAAITANASSQVLQTNAGGTGVLWAGISTGMLPTGTTGWPLVGNGTSSGPGFAVLSVPGGGTNATTLTAHGVLLGQGTSTIGITAAATANFVLAGNGTGSDPTFQNIVTLAVLRGYIDGVVLSNDATTANTKIDVAAGQVTDDTNAVMITSPAGVIDCTTVGANGLDTGVLITSTWYHAFVIAKAGGTSAALLAAATTGPIMPATYTVKRRVGSFKTNASSIITAFNQKGDLFSWGVPIADVSSANNPGTSAVTRTLSTPLGVKTRAILSVVGDASNTGTSPGGIYISDPDIADTAASANVNTSYQFANITSGFNEFIVAGLTEVWTSTSSTVRSRLQASNANFNLTINTNGWFDPRGKNT